jgi:hypothetical protein
VLHEQVADVVPLRWIDPHRPQHALERQFDDLLAFTNDWEIGDGSDFLRHRRSGRIRCSEGKFVRKRRSSRVGEQKGATLKGDF